MLDQRVAESIPAHDTAQHRDQLAHTTARAILGHSQQGIDARTIQRLVNLVDTEGIDMIASLWADAEPVSLPGALWRLYVIREWIQHNSASLAMRYSLGLNSASIHEVVAGLPVPPGPQDLYALANAVLTGAFVGDVDVALDRAAAFCSIIATGTAHDADAREVADATAARRMTRNAAQLATTAQELREAAQLWRQGKLD